MLYITPDEVRAASMGLALPAALNDAELAIYCQMASDAVDHYCDNVFGYQHNPEEVHIWNGESLKLSPYAGPIRTVNRLWLVSGVSGGRDTTWDIGALPAGTGLDAYGLPTSWGQVKINRQTNRVDAASFLIQVASFAPQVDLSDMQYAIDYTSGFDNGTIQPDGYSVPVPSWLRTAARWTLLDILGEYFNNARGLVGMQEVRVADTLFRKPMVRNPAQQTPLPLHAKVILDREWTAWVA